MWVWNRQAVYKFKCLFLAANPDCKDCSIAVCELFFCYFMPFAATKPRIINLYVRIIVFYPRRKPECIRAFSFHSKTLVIHPGSTISLHSTDKQKEDAGVFEDLIRVSVGIEDIDDLKEDFAQAFANIAD